MSKAFALLIFFDFNICFSQDFVFVKGGVALLGNKSPKDNPRHLTYIRSFYISTTEVTNNQFVKFLNEKGNQQQEHVPWISLNWKWRDLESPIYIQNDTFKVKSGYENYPVIGVTWYGAKSYCQWVGGRLPYEAEWEYLAKEQMKKLKNIENYAVFKTDTNYTLMPVCSKKSIDQICDLFGNVQEWCEDWYADKIPIILLNKKSKKIGKQKVIRGFSWANKIEEFDIYERKVYSPNTHNITIGFRVVKEKR